MPLNRDRPVAVVRNRPSRSAFRLARALGDGCELVRGRALVANAHRYSRIINWGCSSLGVQVTKNSPEAVAVACNKVRFAVRNARKDWLLPSTPYKATAVAWLASPGASVMCRTTVTGHSGAGIVRASSVQELVDAPLYTLYIQPKAEYRAHVMDGSVILLQQKKRRRGATDVDESVRSHARGWVFVVNAVDPPPSGWEEAVCDAVASCGLDFGAVDFLIEQGTGRLYVLEVNTAPSLSAPSTLAAYVRGFTQ